MDGEEIHVVELEVTGSVGKLYGKGGQKLQRIEDTFGVKVEVTNHGPSEIARVRGSREALAKAEVCVPSH